MRLRLDIPITGDSLQEAFGITEERAQQLEIIMQNAHRANTVVSAAVVQFTDECNTIDEAVFCSLQYGAFLNRRSSSPLARLAAMFG